MFRTFKCKILVILPLLFTLHCAKRAFIDRNMTEYALADATELGALLNNIRLDLEHSDFRLRLDQKKPIVPAGWDSLFSFIHISDVQLRDYGIIYLGKRATSWADKFVKSTKRYPQLDQNDHVPFLALIGAINSTPNKPRFLLHTGDAIDAGSEGEAIAFVSMANQLIIPWFNAVGNHDVLFFGTFASRAIKIENPVHGVIPTMSRQTFLKIHGENDLNYENHDLWAQHPPTETFLGENSRSFRHGFDRISFDAMVDPPSAIPPTSYYSIKISYDPSIRLLVLDTVVPEQKISGLKKLDWPEGANDYIDKDQFTWLERELKQAAQEDEKVFIAGHHPLTKQSKVPLLKGEIAYEKKGYLFDYLKNQKHVVAYFGGHTHEPYINQHGTAFGPLVEAIAPSLHECPQLALLITIFKNGDGQLALRIQPTKGEVIRGRLFDAFNSASIGAMKEAETKQECWRSDAAVTGFFTLR